MRYATSFSDARRFILFHGRRQPSAMGPEEMNAYLTALATRDRVSATQNQALCAILFLYRHVLGDPRPVHRGLSSDERMAVLETLNSERFVDASAAEVYAALLDEGMYLCSISTMYRILRGGRQVRERRDQLRRPNYRRPELLATAPNQVWSWDITKLRGPAKYMFYQLYVILDIFSRYVVGWMVADRESEVLAVELIEQTCVKQGIQRGQLTLHADRGSSMTSKPVAFLLADLGVDKTHSRPHVSNDNPYSESQFKTMKYRPEFPERFSGPEEARAFCRIFFPWYNHEHRHSGIGLLTPATVHYGRAIAVTAQRAGVLMGAFHAHPERFVRGIPRPPAHPKAAWINPPVGPLFDELFGSLDRAATIIDPTGKVVSAVPN